MSASSPDRRPLIVASIMLATFMVAVEATIVATAMPSIVGQLGGFALYSWVFSAFLLAQTTTTIVYGKLADIIGRKPVLIGGLAVFLFGSLLCGLAGSMLQLILFRLLQGIGAGAIQPVTMTIIGDLYKLEERGKVQGYLSSVWASSAVLGPLAGGVIVDNISWSWIFWVNIPIGCVAIAGLALFLRESVALQSRRIDYLGVTLFTIATATLMVLLTETDPSGTMLAYLGAVLVVSVVLFVWCERRSAEPMLPPHLWRRRLVFAGNSASLFAGMALIGLTTILPLYVQGVLGRSPIIAGFTLSMLVFGWPIAVYMSASMFRRFGIRRTLRAGSFLFPLGAAMLLLITPETGPVFAGLASFVMGFGMGIMSFTSVVLIQDSVEWSLRGSATASNVFARSLGSALGATVLGAILNAGIARLTDPHTLERVHELLNSPSGLTKASADSGVRDVLAEALHLTYWGVAILAVLAFVATWMIPAPERLTTSATRA